MFKRIIDINLVIVGEDEWYIAMYAAQSAKLIDLAIAGHVPHFAAFVTFDAAPIRAD